ncbi:uncharacterized protein CANTADRAFT_23966 [Suhomyces tanzawaensis NRRL Y-17324]|uniref:Arrestin-like N-terminal domain-containing protein n=1 Tax=Suhomyces tanzawaensis NRRL Y-17324 TaxID=984487 RepID=A0A1E4SCC3_9ASCO|nr:uncharacterized protein CANTADRAFT_23966 [Suhomyces tanzawaensis NRRL Y-17324]ODV77143.1 hypothetical protein CANTADRAFT_23966 [Suhomyces tanzawaensis NRRL Y-17324]
MGAYDIKVEIDRSATSTFTNYDVIKGTVTLVVTNSISLSYIQVKLEGIAKTQLVIPVVRRKGKVDNRVIQDVHKVLYDASVVFPPENVRQVSLSKDFTLPPGNYTYPFEFKIPLNSSCVKLLGITNKVLINKNFDLLINNGNFNRGIVGSMAKLMLLELSGQQGQQGQQLRPQQQNYHISSPLPPSLSGIGEFASVQYFVKVTCKRSSFLKTNLRAYDPFIFLPLDLDIYQPPNDEDYREVFVRKQLIFRDRIPEIVGVVMPPEANKRKTLPLVPQYQKKGFLSRLFDPVPSLPNPPRPSKGGDAYYPEIRSKDVPFSFEVRFRHPAFLVPTKPPSFRLYLVSDRNPLRYTLGEYGRPEDSNGLGVVYLQRLVVDLTCTTVILVLQTDGSNQALHNALRDENISVCNNSYQNLMFDLMYCKRTKSASATSTNAAPGDVYELEIPQKYFANCVLPDHLSPSFKTCNITRKYTLTVEASFSNEKIGDFRSADEWAKKVKSVDLVFPNIKLLSGLAMTSSLHSSSKTNLGEKAPPTPPVRPTYEPDVKVPVPAEAPSYPSAHDEKSEPVEHLLLPTYDDVVRESSYQDDSEHNRARRRYEQHEQYYNNLE